MSAGDESEVAGTSSLMESTMLEGEECYNPEAATVVWTEKVSVDEQLCRICGNGNEYLIPIFSGEGLEHQLAGKIQKHLPIQVREHDKLPLQVCYQCASTLIAWHDLVTTCVEVEEKLRQMYQQEEEEDDNGADKADFYGDPVDGEMTEDPLKPSISKSATSQATHSPRKKTVTKAKAKKKITATKSPCDLAETPTELLRPKEEQVEADPASERVKEVSSIEADFQPADTCTSPKLEISSDADHLASSKHVTRSSGRAALKPSLPADTRHKSFKEYLQTVSTLIKGQKASVTKKNVSNKAMHSSSTSTSHNSSDCEEPFDVPVECLLSTSPTPNATSRESNTLGTNFRTVNMDRSESFITTRTTVDDVKDPLALDSEPEPVESASPVSSRASGKKILAKRLKELASSTEVLAPKRRLRTPKIREPSSEDDFVRCKICSRKLLTSDSLEKHMLLHESQKCKICNKYLIKKSQRETHYKKHEERPKKSTERLCPTCGKTFSSYNNLYLHNKKHHTPPTHTCKLCGFKCSINHAFRVHMQRHANIRPFMCETCGRGFVKRAEMVNHQRVHSDARPHECTKCEANFKSLISLRKHEILMHDKKFDNKTVFSCLICNQRCVSKKRLSDHMNTHTGERPYACTDCDKTFRSQHTFYQHKDVHKAKTLAFACDECDVKCNTKADLNRHKKKDHNEKDLIFPCENCDKSFDSKAGVIRHNHIVHKIQGEKKLDESKFSLKNSGNLKNSMEFNCSDCDKSFPVKMKLLRHLHKVHNKRGAYACSQCDKAYINQSDLSKHIEAKHSDLKFPCKDCNKVYESSGSLYQHRRNVHLRTECLKSFVCTTCGKLCFGKSKFEMHTLIHTEKSVPCEVCGVMFRRRWDVEQHMRIHTGDKPYPCTICGLSFAQISTRKQHMKNIHKITYMIL